MPNDTNLDKDDLRRILTDEPLFTHEGRCEYCHKEADLCGVGVWLVCRQCRNALSVKLKEAFAADGAAPFGAAPPASLDGALVKYQGQRPRLGDRSVRLLPRPKRIADLYRSTTGSNS